jgi:putative DNA primase/helicase
LEVEAIVGESVRSLQHRGDEELKKFGQRFETQQQVEAIARGLRSKVPLDMLRFSDIHNRHLLALANQTTLEFRGDGSWQIRPSSHKDYLAGCLPISYDPNATCPTWDKAMNRWMREDEAVTAAVWRWMAACLSAERLDKLFLAVGPTRSGKTTFANALRHLLGDLATTLPTGLILGGRGQDTLSRFHKDNAKTMLFGKRLGVFSESAVAAQLDTETVKSLTGGESHITAKYMGKDPFKFEPMFQLLLHTNASPDTKGVDNALVERLMYVEWCDTVPELERDPDLEEKLWAERSGALNRILEAYTQLKKNGLALPQRVRDAAEVYRRGTPEESLKLWLTARTVSGEDADPTDYVRHTTAWKDYEAFCKAEMLGYMGKADFYRSMERQFRRGGKDGYSVYWGVRLKILTSTPTGDVVIHRN